MDIDRLLNPARSSREEPPKRRDNFTAAGISAQMEEDAAILAAFKTECDKVGVPYDPAGLVRHHRGNAGLTAATNALSMELLLKRAHELLTYGEPATGYGAPEKWRENRTRWFEHVADLLEGLD
jgi:hypothetical protein